MTRDRKRPGIKKPVIDEEAILRFATAHTETAEPPAASKEEKPANDDATVRLTISLSRETYGRIVKEAARKERSVEDLLQRHLSKHYGKS
jgi:hypothetical protein